MKKVTPEALHRLSSRLYYSKWRAPARLIQALVFLTFNAVLPPEVVLGPGTKYAHGAVGVVLHPKCRIGAGVLICQGVTIGGRSRMDGPPIVEDNVYLGPGAKVLGSITIGHDSLVGPNAVVLESVPPLTVVGGVPAKILKSGIRAREVESW